MKSDRIRKWVLAGALYLVLVLASYYVITAITGGSDTPHAEHADQTTETENDDSAEHGSTGRDDIEEDHGDHGEYGAATGENEVIPAISYDGSLLSINLTNKAGQQVSDLEINHEKLMHLIIVGNSLEEYYHVHPEKVGEGEFQLEVDLPDGYYKVFTDIKPVGYNYHVEADELHVGEQVTGDHVDLVADTTFSKTVEEVTVTMTPETFTTGAAITLDFTMKDAQPEPYLGALGHVVILDDSATEFIHVHPVSDTDTKFETQFDKPGLYKIWAEFQFAGQVHVYPFVIQVNEG